MIGLLLGLGAAFLVDYLDDSLRTNEDVEALTDKPVLAVVPIEPPPDNRPIAITEPHEFAVEIYRGLRTNIQFLGLDAPMKVIQITSSLPGEGQDNDRREPRRCAGAGRTRRRARRRRPTQPRLHEVFSVAPAPGLTELMLGEPIEMVLHHLDHGLHVVSAGHVPPNPSEMMSNAAWVGTYATSPHATTTSSSMPLRCCRSPTPSALARWVDGVLVVVQADRVRDVTWARPSVGSSV